MLVAPSSLLCRLAQPHSALFMTYTNRSNQDWPRFSSECFGTRASEFVAQSLWRGAYASYGGYFLKLCKYEVVLCSVSNLRINILVKILSALFLLPTLMQNFYSLTICILHYNPRHVSSINMPIFRMTNFIITASGIVTLCKRLYSMPDESRLQSSLLSSGILYSLLERVTIPDVVIIQFVILKMGILMLETCRGL